MTRRSGRCGLSDPIAFFEALRPARQACTDQLRCLPIMGPDYRAMMGIVTALDAAANLITQQPNFYVWTRQPDVIGRNRTDA